jgi:N-methylhydantoinase B
MSAVPERIDAVTYQVIQSRLSGIVQEMQESIFRTGYSTIIRESQDASCMILDADGDVAGEHVVLPLHATCLPAVVRNVKAAYGDIAAGDIFITNHPYLGGVPHSMDMAVVAPVFSGAQLVGFCASIAHKSDLGGPIPGTANGSARDIFHEGIQYPPIRLMRDGRTIGEVEAILNANSRTPQLVLGDIRGQIGVARLGERRILETIARYGLDTLLAAFARKQDATERQIRATLLTWKDGVHEAESLLEMGDASRPPVRFHVRIEKMGDRIAFDLTGCDDQVDEPINIHPPLVRGCIAYAMIATIDPELANNGGVARVIEARFRPGSIVDPNFPAPTNSYIPSTLALTEACLEALTAFVPERRIARVGGFGAMSLGGTRTDGSRFVQYELAGSAYGGRVGSDGPSGIAVLLSNARSASIEILESEFPTRIRRFELITDSGGAGQFRGGLAARREVEVLAPEAQLSLRGHGHRIAAAGRDGGAAGKPASCTLHPGTTEAQSFPARFSGVRVRTGDRVLFERGGGGGLGDPQLRPLESIIDDVRNGYVSRESAVHDYGISVDRLEAALA